MVVVKKSDILNGIKKIEKVKLEALNGGEMYLRPLSQAEINEVDEIEAKAMGIFETNETAQRGRRQKPKSVVESRGKINLELQQKAQHQAKTKAIFLSLDNEKNVGEEAWSETEIEQMPHKLFEELFEKVREISGIELHEDDVDTFH